MKKQLMRVVSTTIFSKFFKATAFVMILSGAGYLNAQVIPASTTIAQGETPAINPVITHLGTVNNVMTFQVQLDNASGKKFNVIIRDNDGSTLYNEAYTVKDFNKKFKIPKGDNEKLTFIIKSASGNLSQTFEINSNIHYVEEVIVKKIA